MPPLHQLIFMTMWFAACSYAAVRGGAPERLAAAAQFSAGIATLLCGFFGAPAVGRYRSVELGIAITDFALFAAILAIALFSARFWPMLMASMLGCGLFGHLARPLGPDVLPRAYYATVALWGYPVVILLAVATWRHRVRIARYGVDYGWVRHLPRRYREGWSVNEIARP